MPSHTNLRPFTETKSNGRETKSMPTSSCLVTRRLTFLLLLMLLPEVLMSRISWWSSTTTCQCLVSTTTSIESVGQVELAPRELLTAISCHTRIRQWQDHSFNYLRRQINTFQRSCIRSREHITYRALDIIDQRQTRKLYGVSTRAQIIITMEAAVVEATSSKTPDSRPLMPTLVTTPLSDQIIITLN